MKRSSKTLDLFGKTLSLSTGVLAEQATGSVLGRIGDTMVLSTVVMGEKPVELDYFPLTVEYIERLYAGGRIKGSKWVKREGRPSDEAILAARLIDRSIRPLFPKQLKKEVQVVVTLLSVDGENDPDVLSLVTTSAALAISKIPWNGPIGAVRVGLIGEEGNGQEEYVINPESSEFEFLNLEMVVAGTAEKTLMIEAGAKQVSEDVVLEAIRRGEHWNGKIRDCINELVAEVGEKKEEVVKEELLESSIQLIEKSYKSELVDLAVKGVGKEVGSGLDDLANRIFDLERERIEDKSIIKKAVDFVFKKSVRERILKEGKRPDGRGATDIRPIDAQVSVLPRTHGSAIFARGETQVLTVATLGAPSLEQLIESPSGEGAKRYMHHYSMPPYSVGETGRMMGASRREIGHGALAERSLLSVIPPEAKFPYAIRIVSEVMSSNGSTSMASVCGSTLSLMDAGVPITEPVAGIAIGLVKNKEKYVVLSDIIGLEDFSGDMDFKVAGTKHGITAMQLDVKNDGLSAEVFAQALKQAKDARLFILEKILSVLPKSRTEVSRFAPKIKMVKIDVGKIGEVIGSGGKVIRNIIATTGADVEVDEDGTVTISAVDAEAVEKAASWIALLTRVMQRGEVFEGIVKRMLPFGAMVEIVPGKEGLVHVSEMGEGYVKNPADVVSVGQKVKVRVTGVDEQGRTNLSMKSGDKKTFSDEERKYSVHFGRRERFPRRKH